MSLPIGEDEAWVDPEPLHTAASSGDLAAVIARVEAGDDLNAFDEVLGWTPLHHAACRGSLPIARYLLEQGADVNAHDDSRIGNIPLAEVAQECSLEMARLLIDFGADPTIRGWMQLNALDRVANRERGDGPEVRALLQTAARRRSGPSRKSR